MVGISSTHQHGHRPSHPGANVTLVEEFASSCTVIGTDAGTARSYGSLKAQLKGKGRPIPENDIWIAASALQHGLVLATSDSHFEYVEGLQLEAW